MRLLQRYILLELFRTFSFLLIVVTVLLVFVGVFNEASANGLGPVQIMQILPFVVPSLLPFTIPATLLLAVCIVFGRVAGDNEITAAKAAGISVMSLLWPAFILGGVMSVCSILLTDQVIPWAISNIQKTIALALEDIFIDRLRATHEVTDKERGFSITVMAVQDKTLIRPCFKYVRNGRDDVTVQAQTATLEFDLAGQQVILHLVRGHIDIPGRPKVFFEKESQPFPLPYSVPPSKARHLGIREISSDLKRIRREQQDRQHRQDAETALALAVNNVEHLWTTEYEKFAYYDLIDTIQSAKLATEVHSRFAMATSCLVFVLLGSPFAIIQARRQFLTSFMLCFFPILVCYYPLMMLMMNQSKVGVINPAWAMWVPNAVMVVFAGFALRRVRIH